MLYLTQRISNCSRLSFETKVARNYEKQGYTKSTNSLDHCFQNSWELAMHEYDKDTGYTLDEVKT